MKTAKKGDWVQISNVVLPVGSRAPQVPEDTAKCDLLMWVKGFIQQDAQVGDTVEIITAVGRRETGTLCDYCTASSTQHEYHIYGRETINMFFRNKFGFRQYSISEAEVVNEKQAEFIANFSGYHIMAIATVLEADENGLIKRLTVRPK